MLIPPSRSLFKEHQHRGTFKLLLEEVWPIVNQSILQFSGFVPFGMGYDGDRVIPFQWPISKPMPTFGLIEWVAEQQKQHRPSLKAAALVFSVQIHNAQPKSHTVIVLHAQNSLPIKIFVPYERNFNDSWWSEVSDRGLL